MKRVRLYSIFCLAAIVGAITFTSYVSADKGSGESPLVGSTTIVISQAYGGGGGTTGTYLNDYVELHNVSNTTQSLAGLSIMYGSSTGQFGSSATNLYTLTGTSIAAGKYYLVQLSPAGTGGVALPVAPDETSTNVAMSGTNGKVALVTAAFTANTCGATATPCTLPNAAIVDLVAWGVANNAEGGAATNGGLATTATQGNVRKGGGVDNGCTDTDNNNADFDIITAPVPRNSASAAVTCGAVVVNTQHVVDFNGDGKTDFGIVRNTGGGPSGQLTWFINYEGTATTNVWQWGLSGDFFTPVDYDGDGKTDIAVWRSGAPGVAAFYILNSGTNTARVELFGQTGDDPSVVGDYDGDGKADLAVYRAGAVAGAQSTWFYRGSLSNPSGNVTYAPWGQNGDFPAPGDYDGDHKADFVVQRNNGGGQARFWMRQTTAGYDSVVFGTPTDTIVPGDYDGDGKTDLAVVRSVGGQIVWYVRPSSTGVVSGGPTAIFGTSATDFVAHGDYDGDGKTDFAIWRPSATPGASAFYVQGTTAGSFAVPMGANGDYPVANYNRH